MKRVFAILILLACFNSSYSQSYFIPQYNSVDAPKAVSAEAINNNKTKSLINKIRIKNTFELQKIDKTIENKFLTWDKAAKSSRINGLDVIDKAKIDLVSDKQELLEEIGNVVTLNDLKALLTSREDFIDANFENEDYELINAKVKALKEENTNDLLLTKVKKTKTFYLWQSNLYDVETFNGYFSKTGLSAFSNVSIQAFDKATYVNAELISFYFNYVRLGVSGSLKATNNAETDADAIKQDLTTMLHNSGCLNLNFSVPILFNRDRNDHIHYGLFAETSVGITPNFEEANDNAYFSNDILVNHQMGLNLKFDISSNETAKEKQARFLIEFPVHYSYGNKRSYQLLDISDHTTMRVNVGAVLGDKISFTVSGPILSTKDQIMKTPFLFSLNFAPNSL